MAFDTWITFLGAWCLIAISPGSAAVLSMSHGLSYGLRRTSVTILGLQLGLMLIVIIAGIGVGALLLMSDIAFNIVKILGALYLIYLGWLQWCSPVVARSNATDGLAPVAIPTLSVFQRLTTGFWTNATNPKAILFMVAVLPQFIDQNRPLGLQLFSVVATIVGIDISVMHGYAFIASAFQRVFNNAKAIRILNRLFGGLLITIGGGLFFVQNTL